MSRREWTTDAPRHGCAPASGKSRALPDPVTRAVLNARVRLLRVNDVYEFDRSRWAAGPRRATQLVHLTAAAQCELDLPRCCRPEALADELDDCRDAWGALLAASLEAEHSFRVADATAGLAWTYRISDVVCRVHGRRLQAQCCVEAEGY